MIIRRSPESDSATITDFENGVDKLSLDISAEEALEHAFDAGDHLVIEYFSSIGTKSVIIYGLTDISQLGVDDFEPPPG